MYQFDFLVEMIIEDSMINNAVKIAFVWRNVWYGGDVRFVWKQNSFHLVK